MIVKTFMVEATDENCLIKSFRACHQLERITRCNEKRPISNFPNLKNQEKSEKLKLDFEMRVKLSDVTEDKVSLS
jgi:hypothetical protein